MKPLPERLNDRLEQQDSFTSSGRYPGSDPVAHAQQADTEVDELVTLAQRFQVAPQLQPAPEFADLLERRMLRHHLELQQQRQRVRGWSILRLFRVHPALVTLVSLCLVLLMLSTGVLALAAQANTPLNPFYGIKQWEWRVRTSFAHSPADQAALDLGYARTQLNTLSSLTGHGHEGAYLQALADLNQQMTNASNAIKALPAGEQQTQLAGQLDTLENQARQELRGLLPNLTLQESLETTTELARLGDSVPQLSGATLLLPAHPNEAATIHLSGSGIQPGAQLLVDGHSVQASGTLQAGEIVFTLAWAGEQHPHSLGILNPDGTAAMTTAIDIEEPPANNQNGNGNKPTATPTPHGNKPTTTPTPHH